MPVAASPNPGVNDHHLEPPYESSASPHDVAITAFGYRALGAHVLLTGVRPPFDRARCRTSQRTRAMLTSTSTVASAPSRCTDADERFHSFPSP